MARSVRGARGVRFACRDRTVNLSTEQSLYLSNRENNDDDGGLGGEHAGHGADENVSEPAALAHVPREGAERPCFRAPMRYVLARARVAINRLELDTSIYLSLRRLRAHQWTRQDKCKYLIMAGVALFSLSVMERPGYPLKLVLPLLYALAVLVPVTSQFVLPATPILTWLMLFYSAQFVPVRARPHIWVSLLPTLERVWFGASISELLVVGGTSSIAHTRSVGNRILDICAWIPYGIVHYCAPFFVATALFILAPPGSVKFFAAAFGFLNMIGVLIQIALPCVPPWYVLRDGLAPATYDMKGSPAGLARIDAIFHSHGYTKAFTNAPVPFGAFPSLHAACATIEALVLSYFFPVRIVLLRRTLPAEAKAQANAKAKARRARCLHMTHFGRGLCFDMRIVYWAYAGWLYWCTMYLMHHFLIDLVAGACLATTCFHAFLPDDLRDAVELRQPLRCPSIASCDNADTDTDGVTEATNTESSRDGYTATTATKGRRPHAVAGGISPAPAPTPALAPTSAKYDYDSYTSFYHGNRAQHCPDEPTSPRPPELVEVEMHRLPTVHTHQGARSAGRAATPSEPGG